MYIQFIRQNTAIHLATSERLRSTLLSGASLGNHYICYPRIYSTSQYNHALLVLKEIKLLQTKFDYIKKHPASKIFRLKVRSKKQLELLSPNDFIITLQDHSFAIKYNFYAALIQIKLQIKPSSKPFSTIHHDSIKNSASKHVAKIFGEIVIVLHVRKGSPTLPFLLCFPFLHIISNELFI